MAAREVEDYKSSLCDLTVNSKPLISMLTMLAEENQAHAKEIVAVIEKHILQAKPTEKLPSLYLIDSILKNLKQTNYSSFFQQNIVNVFCDAFEKVEERTRTSMYKLRQTWSEVLPARKLYALDVRVNQIDPAWPIVPFSTASASSDASSGSSKSASSIHINPKFLQQKKSSPSAGSPAASTIKPSVAPKSPSVTVDVNEQLLQKQKELEALSKQLELARAQAAIEAKNRELAELKARLTAAVAVTATPLAVPSVTDPRLATTFNPRTQTDTHLAADPRLKTHAKSDVYKPCSSAQNSSEPEPAQASSQSSQSKSPPPATGSMAALLNQAAAEASLGLDEPAVPFKRFRGDGRGDNRMMRGGFGRQQQRGRGVSIRPYTKDRGQGYQRWQGGREGRGSSRVRDRELPYERPSATKKRVNDDETRPDRRQRSRSRSRSSRSRSRSKSPSKRSKSPSSDTKSDKKLSSRGSNSKKNRRQNEPAVRPNEDSKSTPTTADKTITYDETEPGDRLKSEEEAPLPADNQRIKPEDELSAEAVEELQADKHKTKQPSKIQIKLEIEQQKPKTNQSGKNSSQTKTSRAVSESASDAISSSKSEDLMAKPSGSGRTTPTKPKKSPAKDVKKHTELPSLEPPEKKKRKGSPASGGRRTPPVSPSKKRQRDSLAASGADQAAAEEHSKKVGDLDKDEDLRLRKEQKSSDQWQSNKIKQLPRIPRRKGQYRGRDATSPTPTASTNDSQEPLTHPDDEDRSRSIAADVDLRALPVVRAPCRTQRKSDASSNSDPDNHSSDSDDDILAAKKPDRKYSKAAAKDNQDIDLRGAKRSGVRKSTHLTKVTDEADEDLRVRPPPTSSRASASRKRDTDLRNPTKKANDRDQDLRADPHKGWNNFKKHNPKDFYTPPIAQGRQNEPVKPLHMNDKGLDMLDQKAFIISQAKKQLDQGLIDIQQFEQVKYRIQELELIKRAQQVKSSMQPGRPAINNPYDQRGGGPMSMTSRNMAAGNVISQGNVEQEKVINLLLAMKRNSNDPRVKAVMEKLQGGANQSVGASVRTPASGRAALLPTPPDPSGRPGLGRTFSSEGPHRHVREVEYKVIIDGAPFELTMGRPPRRIRIGSRYCYVQADIENREILIDGVCYYRVGEKTREVSIAGQKHTIAYQGPLANVWINEIQVEARVDAPPLPVTIDGQTHDLRIDGLSGKIYIDGDDIGRMGGPKRDFQLGSKLHSIQFDPPPREILIDGDVCKLRFDGPMPVVMIKGRAHGIRFDGPPREICIDDMAFMVPVDRPIRVKIGMRAHMLGFGGPGQEVVIDGKSYEVMFNGEPRKIRIGGTVRDVRLVGEPPEVKILGEILPEEPPQHVPGHRPLAPPPRPPQFGGRTLLPTPGAPDTRPFPWQQHPQQGPPPAGIRPMDMPPRPPQFPSLDPRRDPRLRDNQVEAGLSQTQPSFSNTQPPHGDADLRMTSNQPAAEPPAATPLGTLSGLGGSGGDISGLFEKLLAAGIITKKPEEKSPDLTSLDEDKLKQKYDIIIQKLYTGEQCQMCGLRFLPSVRERYDEHLDWHFRQNANRERQFRANNRNWYIDLNDWISYEEYTDISESNIFMTNQDSGQAALQSALPSHPDAVHCPIASSDTDDEKFEKYFDDDEEEWHLKDAIRIDDKTYHPVCYEDAVETSILDGSISGDTPGTPSVPSSPYVSIPNPLSSLTGRQSLSSSQASSRRSSSDHQRQQVEPNPFDLLSGLISQSAGVSESPDSKDSLSMLTSLMKSVSKSTAADNSSKTEPSAADEAGSKSKGKEPSIQLVKKEEEIKKEPASASSTVSVAEPPVAEPPVAEPPVATSTLATSTLATPSLATPPSATTTTPIVAKVESGFMPSLSADMATGAAAAVSAESESTHMTPAAVTPHHLSNGVVSGPVPRTTAVAVTAAATITSAASSFDLSSLPSHITVNPLPAAHPQQQQLGFHRHRYPAQLTHINTSSGVTSSEKLSSLASYSHASVTSQSFQARSAAVSSVTQRFPTAVASLPAVTVLGRPPTLPPRLPAAPAISVMTRLPAAPPARIMMQSMSSRPPRSTFLPRSPMLSHVTPSGASQQTSSAAKLSEESVGDNDDGTPVRDEIDDVERCATPVMDERTEEGGTTPVRDEW